MITIQRDMIGLKTPLTFDSRNSSEIATGAIAHRKPVNVAAAYIPEPRQTEATFFIPGIDFSPALQSATMALQDEVGPNSKRYFGPAFHLHRRVEIIKQDLHPLFLHIKGM